MTETDLTVLCNVAGDAECLEADTDRLSGVSSVLYALLQCDRTSEGVSPACVIECDSLHALDDSVNVDACLVADSLSVLEVCDAVLSHCDLDLINSSLEAFEFYVVRHCNSSFLTLLWDLCT